MVPHFYLAIVIHQAHEMTFDDVLAMIRASEYTSFLHVMKDQFTRYLSVFRNGNGAKLFVVVIQRWRFCVMQNLLVQFIKKDAHWKPAN